MLRKTKSCQKIGKTKLLYSDRAQTVSVVFAVISSTFPIILKCSSPGTRFVINEITINHNGTNVLVTSTSDAVRQCNQSRRQVEGRHECHLTVNYGQNGMPSAVTTVAVKYHCFEDWDGTYQAMWQPDFTPCVWCIWKWKATTNNRHWQTPW